MKKKEAVIHATAVALKENGKWQAVLIRGASGSGKSDLALRLLAQGARLVSDDQTVIISSGKSMAVTAPARLKRLLEVRGLGIIRLPQKECMVKAGLALIIDLVERKAVPRMPRDEFESFFGIKVPKRKLHGFDASAALKIRRMLSSRRLVE